jgi:hypothetical protein
LTGLMFQESERHLYCINEDEYVEFNFCPFCGKDLINNKYPIRGETDSE